MSRRFVYLVVDNSRLGTYAMRRINVSRIFYPTRPPNGLRDAAHTIEDTPLPRPIVTFRPPSERWRMEFMLLRDHGKDKIVGADQMGRVLMYTADSHALRVLPSLNKPKHYCISVTVGDSLYVMDRCSDPAKCFEALVYGRPSDRPFGGQDWCWHSLPQPPYVFEVAGLEPDSRIRSYTVVGGSNICVSAGNIGTYSFDTASRGWSKAGDWALPFDGGAEYVPEYNLWFGLSSRDKLLCASDLAAACKLKPPTLCHVWEDLKPPKEWVPLTSYLVHIGSGKFCIAKFFQTEHDRPCENGYLYKEYRRFAVFTGVEVLRWGRKLRMIKHKSIRYRFLNKVHDWVL